MKSSHYVSAITLLLCAGMTGPLWIGSAAKTNEDSERSAAVASLTTRQPTPSLTPAPESTVENAGRSDERLACGLGILSRLRNRGDRCVAVPQYAYPTYQQPTYVYPQAPVCVPQQPQYVQPIVTQPMVTQPMVTQPYVQPTTPAAPGGPCNCQSCCKEFRLTRWRVVAKTEDVMEDYIDCEVETSRFCESSCETGECVETIGIRNQKRHVVKQKPRQFTTTRLEQVSVIEKRCVECGCIRDTRLAPTSTNSFGVQKPVLEERTPTPMKQIAPPNLDNASFEPAYRQSKRLEWNSPDGN